MASAACKHLMVKLGIFVNLADIHHLWVHCKYHSPFKKINENVHQRICHWLLHDECCNTRIEAVNTKHHTFPKRVRLGLASHIMRFCNFPAVEEYN